jgi:hypothetical protein
MDPCLQQWRLHNHKKCESVVQKYNVYAGQHAVDTLLLRPQIRITFIMIAEPPL